MAQSISFFSEYKQSLKNPAAEEAIDLVFFRPLAFLCVKTFGWLPLTPNQISFCAMIAGCSAGVCFAGGDRHGFLLGGLFYALANMLDCCDGMIARLKKNGTPTGRIVDGVIDYINGVAVYAGMGIGLSKAVHAGALHLPYNCWMLMIAAAASFAAHAMLSDKYRNAYLQQARQDGRSAADELQQFKAERERLQGNKGRYFDKILIFLYLKYLAMQHAAAVKESRSTLPVGPAKPDNSMNAGSKCTKSVDPSVTTTKRIEARTVVLWNCIGPSTHISFLVVAAAFFQPIIFFMYVIGAANIWMAVLLLLNARSK